MDACKLYAFAYFESVISHHGLMKSCPTCSRVGEDAQGDDRHVDESLRGRASGFRAVNSRRACSAKALSDGFEVWARRSDRQYELCDSCENACGFKIGDARQVLSTRD